MHMIPCNWQGSRQILTGTLSSSCCTHAGLCLGPLEQSFQVCRLLLYNAAFTCVLTPCLVASPSKDEQQCHLCTWSPLTQVRLAHRDSAIQRSFQFLGGAMVGSGRCQVGGGGPQLSGGARLSHCRRTRRGYHRHLSGTSTVVMAGMK